MAQKIYETKKNGEVDTADSIVKLVSALSEDAVNVLRILGVQIEQLITLARYNPQFGAVIGIFVTNLASHKVDFLKWQHQELVCLDCAGLSVNQTQQVIASDGGILGEIVNGFLNFTPGGQLGGFIVSLGQFFAKHGTSSGPGNTNAQHTTVYVWVPGIIDQTAALIITAIIGASFGISAIGTILGDLTSITKVTGTTPDPTALVKPVPPNVEGNSKVSTQQTFTKGLGPEQG